MALSIPFHQYSGFLDEDMSQLNEYSNQEIRKFSYYLTGINGQLHNPFNLERLEAAVAKGLYFNSTIPFQYGLGSSGALIAALFKQFAALSSDKATMDMIQLKVDFALLESHFHGRSSGLDPLVSFMNRPVLLHQDKSLQTLSLDLQRHGWSFALIDTKTTGATGPLVQHFMECMKDPDYQQAFQNDYLPASNGCIRSLINGEQSFFTFLNQLIHFELKHLNRMIPAGYDELFTEALSQRVYLKLLGSGGGGFLLAIAPSTETMDQWAENNSFELIKVSQYA